MKQVGLTTSDAYGVSRVSRDPRLQACCKGLQTAITLQHVMLARDVSASRNICPSLAFVRTWGACAFKFLLCVFLWSTVLHLVSRPSKSIWLACRCQYVTLRLLWRGFIFSWSKVCTCPPLHKNLNASPSWIGLPHSHGLCDIRCITPVSQRRNWRTQQLSDVPKTCQIVEKQRWIPSNLAFKLPALPFCCSHFWKTPLN